MEKIKVNMSPNPLDVQTIHASQNDGEAREWEFELHNNGELIDTSEITEQLFFKSYKGGTEQILPENTSTPTTSPFKGDIKYPQGLLTDQEFTYRQSPTEEDGLAKITDIKGNTIVWNQLFKIYSPTTVTTNGVTLTTNVDGTVTLNGTATARTAFVLSTVATSNGLLTSNHIYYMAVCPKGGSPNTYFGGVAGLVIDTGNGGLWKYNHTWDSSNLRIDIFEGVTFNNVSFKPQYIDLTLLFGAEKAEEILAMGQTNGVAYFRSLFPLSYYSYNQGSLLSFSGNGIKTVGKNRLNYDVWKTVETRNGTSVWENNGVTITATGNDAYTLYGASSFPVNARVPVRVGESITLSWESDDNVNGDVYIFPNGGSAGFVQINNRYGKSLSYTPVDGVEYVTFRFGVASSGNTIHYKNIMIRFADTDSTFEPYTSSTLSLPISTYFPTGMKSAGSVYDELTESKAITRIGMVDLGSLNWTYQSSSGNMYVDNVVSNRKNNLGFNAICSKYQQVNENTIEAVGHLTQDKSFAFQSTLNGRIIVRDTSYTDATVFKQAMADQNVKLYYELATPTETSFTTASLVTENGEIPLSNNDGVLIGKCTEELSENPGFIDAKIKLSDADGECYSNKIQLHVERSPQ